MQHILAQYIFHEVSKSLMKSFNIITYHLTVRFNHSYIVNSQQILVECDIMKRLQIPLTQSLNSITSLNSIMKRLYLFTLMYKIWNKTSSSNTYFFIQLFFKILNLIFIINLRKKLKAFDIYQHHINI